MLEGEPGSSSRRNLEETPPAGTEDRRELTLSQPSYGRLTHYLFRYPAKFHPPVIAELIARYTQPGNLVLDPFCGSGTALVEATVRGRRSVGIDVDPVAVAVSRAKTRLYDPVALEHAAGLLLSRLGVHLRSDEEYEKRQFEDLEEEEYVRALSYGDLWVPEIPRLQHWFRRYVIVDLAWLLHEIKSLDVDEGLRELFAVVFASIIRNSSNADPVPVSGLEVTSHMRRRDKAGRIINPFALFSNALRKAVKAIEDYAGQAQSMQEPKVLCGDATALPSELACHADAVITSPPYATAVDYYRRHQLEMFWLALTLTQQDRLSVLPKYIGRHKVSMKDPRLSGAWESQGIAGQWESKMRAISVERANAFKHYAISMRRVFDQLKDRVVIGGAVVFVVGHSRWNGAPIPTVELFIELARPFFNLEEHLYYPVKNRYMSYSRRNEANIDEEQFLVFRAV